MSLNPLDLVLGALIALSAFHAFRRGLLREGSIFLGLAGAVIVAGRYTAPALAWFGLAAEDTLVSLAMYLALFAATLVAATAATVVLQPLARLPGLRVVDRLGGLGVGVAQGLLAGALLLSAGRQVAGTLITPYLADSRLAPLAIRLFEAALALAPPEVVPWPFGQPVVPFQ